MNENQPSFADLGQPLIDVTFCVVDLETTGTSTDDGITEVGAVKVRGGEVVGEFQTLVNPEQPISPFVTSLTSITNAMVSEAPTMAQVLPAFLSFAEGCILVAHNARFDVGFLKRSCQRLDYLWPRFAVLDTVQFSRRALLKDEVPNHRLGTLAAHFQTSVAPDHRALSDARATVDVLHGLIERVGSLGVNTWEELAEFVNWVSPIKKAKRVWAKDLPNAAGVYMFVHEAGDKRQVLYVGKSHDLRSRVRTYFTAAETRPRMDEMLTIATGVEYVVCETPLAAEVLELRLIDAHRPRYNRKSKFPERKTWIKITNEPFPRLSLVTQVLADGAQYVGPFPSRRVAESAILAIYETLPIRQCTKRLSQKVPSPACVLAEMGRCLAPCQLTVSVDAYQSVVAEAYRGLSHDVRPIASATSPKLRALVAEQRFEDAQVLSQRLQTVAAGSLRHHRLASLAACAEIVAVEPVGSDQLLHIIRYGRLAASGRARVHEDVAEVVESMRLLAETVAPPPPPASAALVEETQLLAAWLERPQVQLLEIKGAWHWPVTVGLAKGELARHLMGPDKRLLRSPPATAVSPTPDGMSH